MESQRAFRTAVFDRVGRCCPACGSAATFVSDDEDRVTRWIGQTSLEQFRAVVEPESPGEDEQKDDDANGNGDRRGKATNRDLDAGFHSTSMR